MFAHKCQHIFRRSLYFNVHTHEQLKHNATREQCKFKESQTTEQNRKTNYFYTISLNKNIKRTQWGAIEWQNDHKLCNLFLLFSMIFEDEIKTHWKVENGAQQITQIQNNKIVKNESSSFRPSKVNILKKEQKKKWKVACVHCLWPNFWDLHAKT